MVEVIMFVELGFCYVMYILVRQSFIMFFGMMWYCQIDVRESEMVCGM